MEQPDTLSIRWRDISRAVTVRAGLAAFIVIVVLAFAIYIVSGMRDVYRASVIVFIDNPRMNADKTAQQQRDALFVAKALVGSSTVVKKALEISGEPHRPIASTLKGNLASGFDTVFDGRLITLHVLDADPARAAKLANAWGQTLEREVNSQAPGMLSMSFEQQQRDAQQLKNEWLARQKAFHQQLAESGFQIVPMNSKPREPGGTPDIPAFTHPLQPTIERLNAELQGKVQQINALRAEDELFKAKTEPADLLQLPRARNDALLNELHAKLSRLQAQLHAARQARTPDTSEINRLEKSHADALAEVTHAAQRFARQVAIEMKLRQAEHDDIQAQLQNARKSLEEAKARAEMLPVLFIDMQTAQQKYTDSMQYTRVDGAPEEIAHVVEIAEVPNQPFKAAMPLPYLIAGVVLGLLVAVGVCLFLELSNDTVRSAEDVTRTMGIAPPLMIPAAARGANAAGTDPATQEAVHKLTLGIYLSKNGASAPPGIITLTPASAAGNCGELGAQLATALAGAQRKVLLLDGSSKSSAVLPTLSDLAGSGKAGLQQAAADGAIRRLSIDATAGASSLNQSTLAPLLEKLREEFQSVIIVMPPALTSANAAVLASVSDATVLVASSRRTRLDELERSLQMLKSLGSHKCLVVIENVSRADSADLHNKQ